MNHYGIETQDDHVEAKPSGMIEPYMELKLELFYQIPWLFYFGMIEPLWNWNNSSVFIDTFICWVWLNHYGIETSYNLWHRFWQLLVWLNHYGIETLSFEVMQNFAYERYDWTIMELKPFITRNSALSFLGMIEPLWNWNIYTTFVMCKIMYTKVWLNHYGIETIHIAILTSDIIISGMIEPLWNWNLWWYNISNILIIGMIEPLWNWNDKIM